MPTIRQEFGKWMLFNLNSQDLKLEAINQLFKNIKFIDFLYIDSRVPARLGHMKYYDRFNDL